MMYLLLCAICIVLFAVFTVWTFLKKKGKRASTAVLAVLFLAASLCCGTAYYIGNDKTEAPKEISEYCGDSLKELINATKLEFKNVSEDIYEAEGMKVCQREEKIVYVELSSNKFAIGGFCGEFSKDSVCYNGEQIDKSVNAVLEENGFTEFYGKFAQTELTYGTNNNIYAYDTKCRTIVFSFDDDGKGKYIIYFPNPKYTENIINSAQIFSEDIAKFLSETKELNLVEKEDEYAEDIGKKVIWQLKAVEIYEDFILAEKNGTEFKIYTLPIYKTKSSLPKKNEYFEAVGLFNGYEDAWTVKNAIINKNVSVDDTADTIIGKYKNKSSELIVEEENGKLHLKGTSNYGAYTADGYVKKINDTTYFYEGEEGDFYITLTSGGINVTTDTLKSFEGEYAEEKQ